MLWNFLVDGCVDCGLHKTQWTNTSRWHGSPNHHWLWKLHNGLQATWILCLSTLPPDSGTLISKLNAKFTLIWKEDFGRLSNSPVLFLFRPGKMLLTMFLFQKWLGSPFPEDVWAWRLLIHWLQLHFTLCESLPSVWIGFARQYSQARSHPCCLCTFYHSSLQSTLHLIWFETALLEQPPLSVMALCDLTSLWRVSMIVWAISKSAVFPIIVVSKNKRYPQFILYGWSFIETLNVNILIFWDTDFWLSLAVRSNNQKKKVKWFNLHVMNLKYMKVSLFKINYKKNNKLFHPIQIFQDVPVVHYVPFT